MSGGSSSPIDPRVAERFRLAGRSIEWKSLAAPTRAEHGVRLATLHEETTRVAERETTSGHELVVDSGPVGALVLLLEVDRRGLPSELAPIDGGRIEGFADGALRAVWGAGPAPAPGTLWKEIVNLARYALR